MRLRDGEFSGLFPQLCGEQAWFRDETRRGRRRVIRRRSGGDGSFECAEVEPVAEARPGPLVTEAGPFLPDDEQQRVPIAVKLNRQKALAVPRRFALDPDRAAPARPIHTDALLHCPPERVAITPGESQ